MAKKDMVRISLDVSPDVKEFIENLAAEVHTSNSEVIRRGLALMKVASNAKKKSQYLAIADEHDKVVSTIIGAV